MIDLNEIELLTAMELTTKECPVCHHKVKGVRMGQDIQCWCGSWLYPRYYKDHQGEMVWDVF